MVYTPPSPTLAVALDRQRRTRPPYQAVMASLPQGTRDAVTAYVGAVQAEAAARRAEVRRLEAQLAAHREGDAR